MKEKLSKSPNFIPEIPNYEGKTYYFGDENIPIHLDETVWNFRTEMGLKKIPILSVWNPKNRRQIAEAIISGKRIAMYMWGTFGTGYLVNFPEWQKKETDEAKDLREKLKIGRPKNMSFPVLMHPDDEWIFWDFDALHPRLNYLRNAKARYDLYQSGPIHIIAPTKRSNSYLDESSKWPFDNTACYYYMPHPAWEKIIEIVRRNVKHAIFEGGSLNPHQKDPVYKTSDLYTKIEQTPEWAEGIDLIAVCEISEYYQIFRSQTQIRLAQRGSDGISEIVRYGSTSAKRWSEEQRIPVKEKLNGAKKASSFWPYTESFNQEIDKKIQISKSQMEKFEKTAAKIIQKGLK